MSSNTLLLLKYKKALQGFADVYNNASPKDKHQFVYPIRNAGITYLNAKKIGFNVSRWIWKRCTNKLRRDKGNIYISIFTNL